MKPIIRNKSVAPGTKGLSAYPENLLKGCPNPGRVAFICFSLVFIFFISGFGQGQTIPSLSAGSNNPAYQKLLDFDGLNTGSDPQEIIIVADFIYGVCRTGGTTNDGIMFKIDADGTNFQKIEFNSEETGSGPVSLDITYTNLLGWVLCGATIGGGMYGRGTMFKYDANGFRSFQDFEYGSEGYFSYLYDIIVKDYSIYGIGWDPFTGEGVVFFDNIFGLGLKTLTTLSGWPRKGLVLQGDYLYGVTHGGYGSGASPGILYRLKTDGTELTTLHQFDSPETGIWPSSNLVMLDDTLFGTTSAGGIYNFGTIYKIAPDGGGFERLGDYPPDDENDQTGCAINYLVAADTSLYGMDNNGGLNNMGALVRLNYSTGLNRMMEFSDNMQGVFPGSFVISEDVVYGIMNYGGAFGMGVLFRYDLNGRPFSHEEQARVIQLAIQAPEQAIPEKVDVYFVDYGSSINLDTTFSISGSIPFVHSWNIKTGESLQTINPLIEVTSNMDYYLIISTTNGCSDTYSTSIRLKNPAGILEERRGDNLTIYPNPNPGKFLISLPTGTAKCSYEVIDLNGKVLYEGRLDQNEDDGRFSLNLIDIRPGIYLFLVKNGNEVLGTMRLVILDN